jgi:hypothetical protein
MLGIFVVSCLVNILAWIIAKYALLKPPEPLSRLHKGSDVIIVILIIWMVIVAVPLVGTSFIVKKWQHDLMVYIIAVVLGICVCVMNFALADKSIFTRQDNNDENDIKEYILKSFFVDILLFVILFILSGIHFRKYFFDTLHHV